MSHLTALKEMFLTHPYVAIKDLRNWCNYRSRIADLRKEGLDIRAVIIEENGQKIHAYKLVVERQLEMAV